MVLGCSDILGAPLAEGESLNAGLGWLDTGETVPSISDGASDGLRLELGEALGVRLGWLEIVAGSLRNIECAEDCTALKNCNALSLSEGAELAVQRFLGAFRAELIHWVCRSQDVKVPQTVRYFHWAVDWVRRKGQCCENEGGLERHLVDSTVSCCWWVPETRMVPTID